MPALTDSSKLEKETIIRWDETDEPAILWTVSAKVRQEWEAHNFPVKKCKMGSGWQCQVPKDRISYKVFKK